MRGLDQFDIPRSEWERLIDEGIIGKNSERDRAMLRRRLFDGLCYEELAEEFYLSTTQTKTIIYKSLQKIIKHI